MALLRPGSPTALMPVHGSVEAVDVTGAGDTVMAMCTVAMAAGADPLQAMRLANVAGALKVQKTGTAAVVVGEVWNVWFPINKNLWTSSYVVFTAGYAMLALAAVYWVVDVKGWRKWAMPFLVFGSNAILVFTLSTWMTKMLLITRVPNGLRGSMSAWSWIIIHSWRPYFADVRNSSLAFALSYVLLWLAVMCRFYRKHVFVKI